MSETVAPQIPQCIHCALPIPSTASNGFVCFPQCRCCMHLRCVSQEVQLFEMCPRHRPEIYADLKHTKEAAVAAEAAAAAAAAAASSSRQRQQPVVRPGTAKPPPRLRAAPLMSERIVTPGMRTTERDVVRNYLVSERKPLASFNSRRSTTGHGYSDQRIPVLTARQVAQCLTMEEFLRLNLRIVQLLDLGFHSDEEDLAAVDRPLDVLRDLVAEPNRGGMGMTAEQLARHGTGQLELIYMGRFCGLSAADNLFEKPPDGVGLTLDLMHTHSSTLPLAQLVEWCGLEASHLIDKCKWQFYTEDVGAWTLSDFKLLGFTAPMLAERCALTKDNLCAIGWTLGEWISLGLTGEVLDRLDVQDQYDLPALWDQKKLRILLGNRYRIEGPENGDDVSGDVEDATSSTSRERYPLATTTTTTGRERYPPATTRESYPLAAAARLPPPLVVPRPSDGRGLRRIVPTVPRGELQWQPAPGKSQQQQRPAARPGAGRG